MDKAIRQAIEGGYAVSSHAKVALQEADKLRAVIKTVKADLSFDLMKNLSAESKVIGAWHALSDALAETNPDQSRMAL